MARGLVVRFGEEESSFGLTKVDREKLYGRKDRIVVDEEGNSCSPAYLTSDGVALVPSGGAAYLYTDDAFDVVERGDLVAVDATGAQLPLCPSTLGVAQPLAEVAADRILDHIVTSVYALSADEVGAALAEKLAAGAIFETRFNWREDYADAPAFLLKNADGYFALVAQPTQFEFLARETVLETAVEEESDDDLDFSMI
jgi:hypothetical protein